LLWISAPHALSWWPISRASVRALPRNRGASESCSADAARSTRRG
jgi:hypothetical protein